MVNDEYDGSYHSPEAAAEDAANGHTSLIPAGLVPVEVHEMAARWSALMSPRHFTATDGVTCRVFDARMREGRTSYADPPAGRATSHIFRPPEGCKRHYTFTPGESREPTDDALARQLRSAGYLPTMPPHVPLADPAMIAKGGSRG